MRINNLKKNTPESNEIYTLKIKNASKSQISLCKIIINDYKVYK